MELVEFRNGKTVTTSLQVAKVFNKRHDRVLEVIETKIDSPENSGQLKDMFSEDAYQDKSGKWNKMYVMNRDGFSFVAFGFTGKKQTNSNSNISKRLIKWRSVLKKSV